MRTNLASSQGERKRFRGTFVRVGRKTNFKGYSEDTILLRNIIEVSNNMRVSDHVWFTFTKGFEDAGIREGDLIEFDARIKAYKKGYVNKGVGINTRKTDYKLSHPTRISVVRLKQ